MTLIDTTVWIDYFRNRSTPETDWLDREVSRQRLGLTDLILCEVLQGIRTPREFDATRAALEQFEIFSTGGIALAVTAAQHYQTLRLQGVTFPQFRGHQAKPRASSLQAQQRSIWLANFFLAWLCLILIGFTPLS